jgi:transposase
LIDAAVSPSSPRGNTQRSVGLVLGGEGGARLIERLGMATSPDTVLRIVRGGSDIRPHVPRILGVDDWAWRRGKRYGTVLIDHKVVDLLPDRAGGTLATWLKSHPGVEIIASDRGGAYARGAREGAPNARQVADRWHMLRNCSDILLSAVERRYRLVREIGKSFAEPLVTGAIPLDERLPTSGHKLDAREHQRASRARRMSAYQNVADLRAKGWTISAIAVETGLDRKTVRQWLVAKHPGLWQREWRNPADKFADYLQRRWDEGCRNAMQLHREVSEAGYRGNAKAFRGWVKTRLRDGIVPPPRASRVSRVTWRPPSSRQTTRLLTTPAEALSVMDRRFIEALRTACPPIAVAADLARRFHVMLVARDIDGLDSWLVDAELSDIASFARGLRRDIHAVRAAFTLPWSTGPVEGKINKLKLIKRSMYGRAGLDLLRARVMA